MKKKFSITLLIFEYSTYLNAKYGSSSFRATTTTYNNCFYIYIFFSQMSRHVEGLASKIRTSIKEEVAKFAHNGIGMTTDIWTDDYRRVSYLSLTLHYVANKGREYAMMTKLAALVPMDSKKKKSYDVILPIINQKINQLGLDEFRDLITFVTDRGTNIVKALRGFQRLNCQAHFIDNIVKQTYRVKPMAKIIKTVRKIARYIKINGLNETFDSTIKSFSETRWNSAVTMLESVYKNWDQLESLLKSNKSQHSLANIRKEAIKSVIDFLLPFKSITAALEKGNVTLHEVLPAMSKIRAMLLIDQHDSSIVKKMKVAASTYYNSKSTLHKYHYLATALHPETNSMKSLSPDEKLFATRVLREEYNKIKDEEREAREVNEGALPQPPDLMSSSLSEWAANAPNTDDEIESFLRCNQIHVANPIDWWHQNRAQFPTLYRIAVRVLTLPATSAQSEREFSMAGLIVTSRRCALKPQKVEDIMLVYRNS